MRGQSALFREPAEADSISGNGQGALYRLVGPDHRIFPHERLLAQEELAALTGTGMEVESNPDILRRIAFSSRVVGNGVDVSTDIALLERATNNLLGRGVRRQSHYLTHGLHRFKGKFYPHLARALINRSGIVAGDLVLDIFMGSGTTLVESSLLGIDAVGFDINPLSVLIASTKVGVLNVPWRTLSSQIDAFESSLAQEARVEGLSWRGITDGEPLGAHDYPSGDLAEICGSGAAEKLINSWFPGSVRHKLAISLRSLRVVDHPVARDFLRVCLSDLVRSCSQQDPRDLRARRRAHPIGDAPVLNALLIKARGEMEKLRVGQELTDQYPWETPKVVAELRDARDLCPKTHPVLSERPADAVISSPPYAVALPYVDTDRLSLIILGLLSGGEIKELEKGMIGSREIADRERRDIEDEMEDGGLRELPEALESDLRDILTRTGNTAWDSGSGIWRHCSFGTSPGCGLPCRTWRG